MTNNMYVDSTNMKHNSNFSLLNVPKSLAGEVDFSVRKESRYPYEFSSNSVHSQYL